MGTPLTIVCQPLVVPTPPPQITIPHFGTLQVMFDAIDRIPDPMDLLCKLQDLLAVAMAPVRRFLEMIEGFAAIKQCFTAIPEAIMTLNPDPIYECLKQLAKALATLLSWIPPLSYVRLALDIINYCTTFLDAIINFFTLLDLRIGAWIEIYEDGLASGDLELVGLAGCGMQSVTFSLNQIMPALQFIMPINNVLMGVFTRLMNMEGLKQAQKKYTDATTHINKISNVIGQAAAGGWDGTSLPDAEDNYSDVDSGRHTLIPFPTLGPLLSSIAIIYNALVMIYNLLAPVVGDDPDKEGRSVPTFSYL
jgi:hypothetical protein